MNRKNSPLKLPVRREGNPLDISGLMDIIFILLIFVMLSISFQKKFTVMEMDLPSTREISDTKETSSEILLLESGKIFLDDREVSQDSLTDLLKQKKPENVRLNAERKISYEAFIEISILIKNAGIDKIDLGLKNK